MSTKKTKKNGHSGSVKAKKTAKTSVKALAKTKAAKSIASHMPAVRMTIALPAEVYNMAVRVADAVGLPIGTVVVLMSRRGSTGEGAESAILLAASAVVNAREGLISSAEAKALGAGVSH